MKNILKCSTIKNIQEQASENTFALRHAENNLRIIFIRQLETRILSRSYFENKNFVNASRIIKASQILKKCFAFLCIKS